jgi:hypothetical protein
VVAEMEEVTEGVNNLAITEPHKKNRIQVSNTKKPLFFYVNLAKVRFFPFLVFFSFFFSSIVWAGYCELLNQQRGCGFASSFFIIFL